MKIYVYLSLRLLWRHHHRIDRLSMAILNYMALLRGREIPK